MRIPAVLLSLALAVSSAQAQDPQTALSADELSEGYADWTELAPGLELRALRASQPSRTGDELIVALRIDPAHHEFVLLIADAEDGTARTARDWAARDGLVAAVNAGMFQATDAAWPVGRTRVEGGTVNPAMSADRTMFAFAPDDAAAPYARILDRDCEDFAVDGASYANLLQSIRMISCDGRNVWSQQPREWSTAALATDAQGRVLFIHVRSPYSVHDFIAMLQASPLGVERAMYLEGGPEATLFARGDGVTVERVGSFETGFFESDSNTTAWPLPNVIGVRPRADE
jgi:hypothetical protein